MRRSSRSRLPRPPGMSISRSIGIARGEREIPVDDQAPRPREAGVQHRGLHRGSARSDVDGVLGAWSCGARRHHRTSRRLRTLRIMGRLDTQARLPLLVDPDPCSRRAIELRSGPLRVRRDCRQDTQLVVNTSPNVANPGQVGERRHEERERDRPPRRIPPRPTGAGPRSRGSRVRPDRRWISPCRLACRQRERGGDLDRDDIVRRRPSGRPVTSGWLPSSTAHAGTRVMGSSESRVHQASSPSPRSIWPSIRW